MRFRGIFVISSLFLLLPFLSAYADVTCSAYKGQKSICVSESVILQKGKCTVRPVSNAGQESLCKTAPNFENCGTVRVITPTGPCATVSKCSRNFAKEIQACLQKIALESGDVIDLTPEDQGEGSDAELPEEVDAVLRGALQGEDAVDALQRAGMGRADAIEAIQKLESGSETQSKEAAELIAEKLTLDPRLLDEKRLGPYDKALDRAIDEFEQKYGSPTFGDNDEKKSGECDLDKAQQVIKYMESGGRYGINTNAGNGRVVHGAYQMLTDNVRRWSCEIGKCVNAAQFLVNPGLQDQIFRHKFEQYKHARGSYTIAAGMWHGGPGFNPNRSDRLGTKTGSYMAKFARLCGDSSFSFNKNDYTQYGGDPYYGSLTGQNSPFANTNPLAPTSRAPMQQQYPQQQVPRPPITPVSSQILPQGTRSGSGSLPPAPVQPAASLIAQPKEVTRGNPITVSWSSVGMSRLSPCSVSIEQGGVNALLVQGNEGTKLVPTSATTTPGIWNFTLQCTLGNGSTIRQSASVSIR